MNRITLNTGDVVITNIRNIPFIEHAGVVIIDDGTIWVWHTSPGKDIVKEHFTRFMERRKLLSIRKTGVSHELITMRIKALTQKKYHILNFKCFDFIHAVTSY